MFPILYLLFVSLNLIKVKIYGKSSAEKDWNCRVKKLFAQKNLVSSENRVNWFCPAGFSEKKKEKYEEVIEKLQIIYVWYFVPLTRSKSSMSSSFATFNLSAAFLCEWDWEIFFINLWHCEKLWETNVFDFMKRGETERNSTIFRL